MKEIAELLGIDTEFVERDLAFYRGVGAGYLSHIGQYSESRSWEPIATPQPPFEGLVLTRFSSMTPGSLPKCSAIVRNAMKSYTGPTLR